MLAGRASLVTLIGKRRRISATDQKDSLNSRKGDIVSPSDSLSPSAPQGKEQSLDLAMYLSKSHNASDNGASQYLLDWVSCPVCGRNICGTDFLVNSHLETRMVILFADLCLANGTKRKMTQRTLLQFNFYSSSKSNIHVDDTSSSKNLVVPLALDEKVQSSNFTKCAKDLDDQDGRSGMESNASFLLSNSKTCLEYSVQSLIETQSVHCNETGSLSPLSSLPCPEQQFPLLEGTDVGTSMATLDTYIVGRRFCDDVDLKEGTCVSFVRDPENVKDHNAIKVLCSKSGSDHVLGFLPRDLALYLSPLMKNHHVMIEGLVTSLPDHSLGAVPVRIFCQKILVATERESDEHQMFQCLWENVARVVESSKDFPPNTKKYQQNFCILIKEVLKHHSYLFTDDEKLFLGSFESLSDDSQRLFIRLYRRKGPWFRISNVYYPEISDHQLALKGLLAAGYMNRLEYSNEPLENIVKEMLDMLTVSECRELSSQRNVRVVRREELVKGLLSAYADGTCSLLPTMVAERIGACVRISALAEFLLWRVQRLFFLNGKQDLSAFLLVDLGLVRYPTYTCSISSNLFTSRSDLLAYEEAMDLAQIMDQSLDENNVEIVMRCIEVSEGRISNLPKERISQSFTQKSGGMFLSQFTASWVYSKVLTLGVSVFERDRRYTNAIMLLRKLLNLIAQDGRRGYWTLRLSIDLEHLGHLNESLLVAEGGLTDPWVRAGSRMALQRRVLRLGKPPRRWKTPSFAKSIKRKIKEVYIMGRPLNCEIGSKNRFYGDDDEQCGVEELALQYYKAEGWEGAHSESGVWMTIFGLLMWDVIFADIPDVFRTRFQTAPLDLCTDSFYPARMALIESHLRKVKHGMAKDILTTTWESNVGTSCQGVNWERHTVTDLQDIVTCVGGPCLASICRLLAQDYKSWSSGMPDLLLWRLSSDGKSDDAKLVEVKGPKDRLSEQQQAWLLMLMDCGFDSEVCKVRPTPFQD
ncbi:fanconi-associated nuclease 1 homolog isoform X2 [Amborella trichopoda]|uniref:fanconi-associated nuclease 1 homolog isoform X2 n=1 Tax=Amborella trichopoda TaxID=13333 RepID=UPI0009C174BC|nr:fanconi-associated nuclease 1 homolog isoform X2 [Amborella trichopoda]|eukprot:XP_020520348.1 fanconi-associated nuclease 1 homolog isoform X2 [Amborella trichopoda]